MSPSGYQVFVLHFGTPYPNNINRYGARGYSNGGDVFPKKGVNMGDQTNDSVNDIAVIGGGYVLMLYGQDIPTDLERINEGPKNFDLLQNYPNPFNPTTTIKFTIHNVETKYASSIQHTTLKVYDILGNEVTTLFDDKKQEGSYEIEFDATKYNLSSGVYFCELKKGINVSIIKMMYLK